MKIQIVSDLHCEFRVPDVVAVADVVVAAGDIGARKSAFPLIDDWLAGGAQVILVLGNHEFYGEDYHSTLRHWRQWADERPNLHLLHRGSVVIDGVRFLGATLWTDFNGGDQMSMLIGRQDMADFRVIRYRGRRLRPIDTVEMHLQDRQWLEKELALPHDGPTVVVTHHLPHEKSVAEQHVGSDLNPAFFSDLQELIHAGQPALWIHGHTHSPCDYHVHTTRVLCNPLGYPNEAFTNFDPALVVDV